MTLKILKKKLATAWAKNKDSVLYHLNSSVHTFLAAALLELGLQLQHLSPEMGFSKSALLALGAVLARALVKAGRAGLSALYQLLVQKLTAKA